MHPECELSIITINYNGLKDTCAQISNRFPLVKVIKSDKNLGFAGGNNLGIKAAQGRYLFLVNNDTFFKEFNIQALINRAESSAEIGVVCPKIRFAWEPQPIQYTGYTELSKITIRNQAIGFGEEDHGQYDTAHLTPYAHGAAMFVKKEAIDKVGLMPECYFLYYEELDWSMMFTHAGYQIWYEPKCTVFHEESQATGQNSPLRTYYITRNRLLLVKRNYHGAIKWLSYIYLMGIVGGRDILYNLFIGKFGLLMATLRGIHSFLKL